MTFHFLMKLRDLWAPVRVPPERFVERCFAFLLDGLTKGLDTL